MLHLFNTNLFENEKKLDLKYGSVHSHIETE